MKFRFNGADYQIEFQREYKPVRVGFAQAGDPVLDEKGKPTFNDKGEPKVYLEDQDLVRPSKFPYTTVKLWAQVDGAAKPELKRSATVGAHHTEEFNVERGRLIALRQITKTITKDLKRAMWKAYLNRDADARRQKAEAKAALKAIEAEALKARLAEKAVARLAAEA